MHRIATERRPSAPRAQDNGATEPCLTELRLCLRETIRCLREALPWACVLRARA